MTSNPAQVLVLASGGVDSSALITYYLRLNHAVHALWVDYGHKAAHEELSAVRFITQFYKVPLHCVAVSGMNWTVRNGSDEIIGRNLLLASLGVTNFPGSAGLVAMGIHSGSEYFDCSIAFMDYLSEIAQAVSNNALAMDFPFGTWTKTEILGFCKATNVPVERTYSCINGVTPPCGGCSSCLERSDWENNY